MNKYSITIVYKDLERLTTLIGPFSPAQVISVFNDRQRHTVMHPDIRASYGPLQVETTMKYIHDFSISDHTVMSLHLTLSNEDMIVLKLSGIDYNLSEEKEYGPYEEPKNRVVIDNVTTNRITESIRVNMLNRQRTAADIFNGVVYLIY